MSSPGYPQTPPPGPGGAPSLQARPNTLPVLHLVGGLLTAVALAVLVVVLFVGDLNNLAGSRTLLAVAGFLAFIGAVCSGLARWMDSVALKARLSR